MNGPFENNDLNKKFEGYTYPVDDSNWEAISAGIPYGNGDGFLSDKFASYAVRPSSHVWNRIDAALRPSSGRRVVAWWWYAAAASVFLFAVFTYVKYKTANDQSPIAKQKVKTENHTGVSNSSEPGKVEKTNSNSFGSDTSLIESNSAFAKAEPKSDAKTKNEKQSTESDFKPAEIPKDSQNENTIADVRNGRDGVSPLYSTYDTNLTNQINQPEDQRSIAQSIDILDSEIQIQLPEAALAGSTRDTEFADSESTNKKVKSSPFYDGTEKSSTHEFSVLAGSQLAFSGSGDQKNADFLYSYDGTGAGIGTTNEFASLSESVNYSTPVYYGVNGEIEFWKRLAAGVGLGYLQMRKTIDYISGAQQSISMETQNRYLSIPVYLKFNFIHKPKFSAYTTLGNAYDIQIWQKTTSNTFENGQLTQTDNSTKNEKGNQANVYAGLGMTFKFTKHFGLYAEGSMMRYYYTSNPNFYSQQNLWPGLRFGAVVTF